jgi:hypothetical protein
VYTFLSADGLSQGDRSGTSLAAPQVTALAAYLRAVDPTLHTAEILTAIIASARPLPAVSGDPACSDWQDPAPVIDALNALLSVEGDAVRRALLDVNDDGAFDAQDITTLLDELDDPSAFPDYGRYDLNGDGHTGGRHTIGFDLDRTGSVPAGPAMLTGVTQDIGGQPVEFSEHAVGDLDVLCFYGFSSLYDGDAATRDGLLLSRCSPLKLYLGPHPLDDPPSDLAFAWAQAQYLESPSYATAEDYVSDLTCLDFDWEPELCVAHAVAIDERPTCEDDIVTGGLDLAARRHFTAKAGVVAPGAAHTDTVEADSVTTIDTGREIVIEMTAAVAATTDGRRVSIGGWWEGFAVWAGAVVGGRTTPSDGILDITNPHATDVTIEVAVDTTGMLDWLDARQGEDNEEIRVSLARWTRVSIHQVSTCARYWSSFSEGAELYETMTFDKDFMGPPTGPVFTSSPPSDSFTFRVPPGRTQYALRVNHHVSAHGHAYPTGFNPEDQPNYQGDGLDVAASGSATVTIRNLGP